MDQGELRAAIRDFGRAIELDPSYAESYYLRSISLMKLGENRRAVEDFDRYIALNPDHEYVRYDRQVAVERADAEDG